MSRIGRLACGWGLSPGSHGLSGRFSPLCAGLRSFQASHTHAHTDPAQEAP